MAYNPDTSVLCVIRMVDTVDDRNFLKVERAYIFETRDVDAVLMWIRSPLVKRIDPAATAEKMLRGHCIELVDGERLFPA